MMSKSFVINSKVVALVEFFNFAIDRKTLTRQFFDENLSRTMKNSSHLSARAQYLIHGFFIALFILLSASCAYSAVVFIFFNH